MKSALSPIPSIKVESLILTIRGQKIMLDSDLADIYNIKTKALNQAVKRNKERFPDDFMFLLTENEAASLRSQIVTSRVGHGGRRYLPYAFTEHGAIMLAAVINSPRAIEASIFIVRAFVSLVGRVLNRDSQIETKNPTLPLCQNEGVPADS